jgi:hypothetical protein
VFRVPGHVPHFADASTTPRARQSGQRMKSDRAEGARSLRRFSLSKKRKTCESNPDDLASVDILFRDENAILCVFPDGKSRAGRAPKFDRFQVGPLAACQPFEEIKYQWVDGSVGHGLFTVPRLRNSAMPAKIHAAGYI